MTTLTKQQRLDAWTYVLFCQLAQVDGSLDESLPFSFDGICICLIEFVREEIDSYFSVWPGESMNDLFPEFLAVKPQTHCDLWFGTPEWALTTYSFGPLPHSARIKAVERAINICEQSKE